MVLNKKIWGAGAQSLLARGMKFSALGLVGLVLAACVTSTPYAPAATQGGYGFAETRIEENRYRITFRGNASTSREIVENSLLLRAAELTVQSGYDYFIVVEGDTQEQTNYTTTYDYGPAFFGRYGYRHPGYYSAFPYYAYGFGWGYPYHERYTREITRYSAIAFIAMYKGPKPADNPQAFDAGSVIENLRPLLVSVAP